MKAIIIYRGKYGATDQYAHWLADILGISLLKAENATSEILAGYEIVIVGSSVYVGNLLLAKWLDRHAGDLVDKKVLLFIVCGTTADDSEEQQLLIRNNLGRALRASIAVFFLPGKCVISRLSWKDRIVLKMGAWLQKDVHKKALMNRGFNHMDKKKLDPLIIAFRQLLKEPVAV